MVKWATAALFVFILCVWFPVERAFDQFCFNNFDLGIYAQAIWALDLNNLNPWLSTREVRLFNDHFDPILLMIAPLRALTHPARLAIRVEMLSALTAALAPLWLAKSKKISASVAIFSAFLILFSPMTLSALYFPAHPGTWGLAPLSWMFAFLYAGQYRRSFAALIILMACKEEFPVTGALVGAVLYARGNRRPGLWFMMASGLWGIFVFKVRPFLWGSSEMYAHAVAGGEGIRALSDPSQWGAIFNRMLYLLIPGLSGWMLFGRPSTPDKKFLSVLCVPLIAMIVIRMLGGYWGNHRSSALAVMSAYLVIGICGKEELSSGRPRFFFKVLLAMLLMQPLETGIKWVTGRAFKNHCPIEPERIDALRQAVHMIKESGGGEILAQGNIIPNIVDVGPVSQIGSTTRRDFKWVIAENGAFRNTWPLSKDQFSNEIVTWKSRSDVTVLADNAWVLLMRIESVPSQ